MGPSTILNIKEQELPPSLDARFLREAARLSIEQLAGESWTDYNLHDPGITLLEVLAYAITDLGLRTRLDIKSLIADKDEKPFFPAREVLPNAAFTPSDYHRLALSHPYVRNAWIQASTGETAGLYQLLLALKPFTPDPDQIPVATSIDLNENWLKGTSITVDNRDYAFYVVFPNWEDLPLLWKTGNDLNDVEISGILSLDDPAKAFIDEYYVAPKFIFGNGDNQQTLEDMGLRIRLPEGIPKAEEASENGEEVQPGFDELFREALLNQLNPDFFRIYQARAREREKQLKEIRQFMARRRNLCEDWVDIDTIHIQHIGLKIAKLELEPDASPLKTLARIYFAIEQFIDPDLRPYRYEELQASGRSPAEIFEGPLLQNGFLPEEGPDQQRLLNIVYTSDLIRIIMQQRGVIGVDGLTLDNYLDRIKVASGVRNCLQLRNPERYRPRLNFYDSEIRVFKRGVPILVDPELLRQELASIRQEFLDSFPTDNTGAPPLPNSDDQPDVTTFYSIQNEFPEVYGLREGEVVKTAPPLRHAQARQLKGYLLLFEQLMVNYCEQLANIQQLFSSRPDVGRTYFYQPLYDVPAVRGLFTAFLSEVDGVNAEGWEQAWQTFKQNDNNGYIQAQKEYTEDEATFLRRRNQFTDHLLARFAEDLSNYSSWSILQNDGQASPALINDKLAFLNGLLSLAHNRATAFDYSATRPDEQGNSTPDVWDSENVSGFEMRVASKLGISNFRRRSLATSAGPDAEEGMHLVEHLLLRPVSEDSDRMEPANLQREEGAPPLIMIPDPYPFQLSIFLPGWAARFQDKEFRAVVERTLREELPAHLFSWIYWVELDEEALIPTVFTTFENTFRLWLENLYPDNPDDTRNNFVKAFNELATSQYVALANTYNPFEL